MRGTKIYLLSLISCVIYDFRLVRATLNMDSLKFVTSESCSSHLKYHSNEMCFAKNNEKYIKTAFRIIMMLQRKTTPQKLLHNSGLS